MILSEVPAVCKVIDIIVNVEWLLIARLSLGSSGPVSKIVESKLLYR